MLDEVERGGIQPLQIVEEQRKRMLRASERANEAPEHQLKSVLRFLRRQVGNGRLFADDELQFGDEVDDELAVRPRAPPPGRPATRSTSASLLTRIWRIRVWKACARVAYGISRLYWSNLPAAKSPRGGTSALCSSLTTEDLPTPE